MNTKIRQKNYHHGELREQLLKVATKHLLDGGAEKLSLRAISRELDVSQTAPYRHFKDKETLLAALATDGFQRLSNEMTLAIDASRNDVYSALQASGIAYINFARKNPEIYRLMFGTRILDTNQHPELKLSGQASLKILQEIIDRGIQDGSFKNQPSHLVINSAWAIVHGLALLIIDRLEGKVSDTEINNQIKFSTKVLYEKI